jgi:hypothetical protein
VSDQIEKSDPTERADEWEDRRLPFSLDSNNAEWVDLESGMDWRGMLEARMEEVGEMMAVLSGLNLARKECGVGMISIRGSPQGVTPHNLESVLVRARAPLRRCGRRRLAT